MALDRGRSRAYILSDAGGSFNANRGNRGSGIRDTETLHRIDPIRMRVEIEAAGFVFESQSDILRNDDGDHQSTVFDSVIRGKTD